MMQREDGLAGAPTQAFGHSRTNAEHVKALEDALIEAEQTAARASTLYDQEREARRTAELVSRAREEVLAAGAPDIRNPLNPLSLTTQRLTEADLAPQHRD